MRHALIARLAVPLGSALMLAGCAVGPDYERPKMPTPTPPQYRFAEAQAQAQAQAQSMADLSWWQVFEDPTLQALVREALANNLDVRVAAARVEEARAQAGIAKSFLYPQVNGVASYGIRQASNAPSTETGQSEDTTHQSGTYGFQLSWELDVFGRNRRQNESANALFLSSEQGRRGVLVTLVGDVSSSYFLLRELDAQLLIARNTLRLNDETVAYFRNRLDGGVSNRLELDQAIANRSKTSTAIPDIENQIAVVENGISMLLGRNPGPIARESPGEVALPPAIPAGLPTALLERRPDVVAAEQMLVSANADVGAAKALFFPNISLTGFLGGVSGDLTTFLGGDGGVWSFGTGLLQPLFQGKRIRRNYEAMQARHTAAVALYQKAALNGYREVANSLITIQKLAEIRVELAGAISVLEDASDLSRARYESGLASYIEILLADQALFQQQLRLAETRGLELRARAELYRTLGGGWQPEPPPAPPAPPPAPPQP